MPNDLANNSLPSKKKVEKHSKPAWQKRTSSLTRWLHTYLSMASFFVLLFFAFTGLTLNHAEWFGDKPVITKTTGKINITWVKTKDTASIDKLDIVEFLRRNNKIKGAVSDFRIEEDNVSVSFNGPGYAADVFINRSDGTFKLSETQLGLIAVLNDLHKGRDTGKGWAILIDVIAVFMMLVSLTGLTMIFFMKKKRTKALLIAVVGFIAVYVIYLAVVK